MSYQRFANRSAAGRALAEPLARYRNRPGLLVLGLPRGGVPVAHEVARQLNAELDVLLVRKLGVPGHPELAMGAIASGGALTLNSHVIDSLSLDDAAIESVASRERRELARREALYRGGRGPLDVAGRTVIIVDDGMATGASMRVAVEALRALQPAAIVVAVPVAPREVEARFTGIADRYVCLQSPPNFYAVGQWYDEFSQTSDAEVRELLDSAWKDAS